jgi:hypothetical protein
MNCPICSKELVHYDYYGRLAAHQDGKVLREIFKYPNGVEQNETCASENFHVAGSFYTDIQGHLHEGYAC